MSRTIRVGAFRIGMQLQCSIIYIMQFRAMRDVFTRARIPRVYQTSGRREKEERKREGERKRCVCVSRLVYEHAGQIRDANVAKCDLCYLRASRNDNCVEAGACCDITTLVVINDVVWRGSHYQRKAR